MEPRELERWKLQSPGRTEDLERISVPDIARVARRARRTFRSFLQILRALK